MLVVRVLVFGRSAEGGGSGGLSAIAVRGGMSSIGRPWPVRD